MWQRVGSGSGAEMVLVQAILRICELDDPAVTQLLDALDEEIQARYDEPVEEFISNRLGHSKRWSKHVGHDFLSGRIVGGHIPKSWLLFDHRRAFFR